MANRPFIHYVLQPEHSDPDFASIRVHKLEDPPWGQIVEIGEHITSGLVQAGIESGGGDVPESTSNPSGIEQVLVAAHNCSGGEDVKGGVDLVSRLNQACRDLGNDEIIHGDDFDLSTVMDVMKETNQKLKPTLISTIYSIDEAIKRGVAPVPMSSDITINMQRVIDVMDHLLASQATWHVNRRLPGIACFYVWRPERLLSEALLHPFCRVISLTTRAVCSVAESAYKLKAVSPLADVETDDNLLEQTPACFLERYHDNEVDADVSVSCTSSEEEGDLISMLGETEHSYVAFLRILGVKPSQTNPVLEGLYKAVLCRIRFHKDFLHLLTYMRTLQGSGSCHAQSLITVPLDHLKSMLEGEEFLRSNSSSRSLESGVGEETTASGRQPIGSGLPVNYAHVNWTAINRNFLAPTRIRADKLLSWKEAVEHFRKLLFHFETLCRLSTSTDLEDVMRYLLKCHKFQHSWVATAFTKLLLLQDGKLYGSTPLFEIICTAAFIPCAASHAIQEHETVVKLGKLLNNLLDALCSTISVQRRVLGKYVRQWDVILFQLFQAYRGEKFSNMDPHTMVFFIPESEQYLFRLEIWKCIIAWVGEHKFWMAGQFLFLGFDLELYSTNEYCMVYWAISSILTRQADSRMSRRERKERHNRQIMNDLADVKLIRNYCSLVSCLYKLLAIVRIECKAFPCIGPFNNEEERFIQHFKPLMEANCLPPYSSFKSSTDSASVSTLEDLEWELCNIAAYFRVQHVHFSGDDEDTKAEFKQIDDIAELNSKAVHAMRNMGVRIRDPSLKVSLDFTRHPHFGVLKFHWSRSA